MKKELVNKYLLLIVGSLVIGLGIAFCNLACLGVDPMSVFVLGMANIFKVSFGTMNLIISFVMLIIGYIFDKKNINLASVFTMVVVSVGIDIISWIGISAANTIAKQVIYLIIGVFLYTFGIALSQKSSVGLTAYDCMVFGFMKALDKEYHIIRWLVEAVFLIVGYFLKGTIGICTVVIILFAGKLVEFFLHILNNKQ